ncbi:hypothetical protein BYT27DRAFT_7333454 [Phlegmacium glaucopus]|nr:hypothetical protein BYT27DRAFT_7333454 [Phlegmacium glaucopus]
MPKDPIHTSTRSGGSSSESGKLQAQPRFRSATTYLESESEIRSKSKSKAKAISEQTVLSRPPYASSSSTTASTGTMTESNPSPNQVEITYNQLVSLGMPTDLISLTEFGRIYSSSIPSPYYTSTSTTTNSTTTKPNLKSTKSMSKAKAKDTTIDATSTLTQALDFICTHLVGRQEVRKRRALISQMLEEHSTRPSKLKAPSNFHKEPTEDNRTLLNNPKETARALNSSARRTLDAVQKEWEVINEDMQRLDIKHRTKKQELEGARRILFLLNVLEKREELRMRRMSDVGHLVVKLRKEADLAMKAFNSAAGSSDRLMNWEGGLKRGIGNVRYRHTTETLARLHRCHLLGQANGLDRLDVVLGRLGVDDENIKRKILQLARKRTREQRERLVRVNQEKERDVQTKINRVVALGFLSEGYLDCRLKDPEIEPQNGYIDKLRLAIIVGESSAAGVLPAKQVRVPERLAIPAITPQNASHLVIPPFASQINPNLSRKSDKSLFGFDIAADIDTLVKQSMKLK